MMRRIVTYIMAAAIVAGLAGCRQFDVDEILLEQEAVSLTIKGEPVFVYDENKCQLACNWNRNEFRAMTDDMSDYFILRAHQQLSDLGQEFTADLIYTTASNVREETGLTFTIEKIQNGSGLIWLWCSSKKIGVVVRML